MVYTDGVKGGIWSRSESLYKIKSSLEIMASLERSRTIFQAEVFAIELRIRKIVRKRDANLNRSTSRLIEKRLN